MKKRKTKSNSALHPAVLILASLLSSAAVASAICEGVAFMPTNLVITRAQD